MGMIMFFAAFVAVAVSVRSAVCVGMLVAMTVMLLITI